MPCASSRASRWARPLPASTPGPLTEAPRTTPGKEERAFRTSGRPFVVVSVVPRRLVRGSAAGGRDRGRLGRAGLDHDRAVLRERRRGWLLAVGRVGELGRAGRQRRDAPALRGPR